MWSRLLRGAHLSQPDPVSWCSCCLLQCMTVSVLLAGFWLGTSAWSASRKPSVCCLCRVACAVELWPPTLWWSLCSQHLFYSSVLRARGTSSSAMRLDLPAHLDNVSRAFSLPHHPSRVHLLHSASLPPFLRAKDPVTSVGSLSSCLGQFLRPLGLPTGLFRGLLWLRHD